MGKFNPSYRGIGEMLKSPEMVKEMESRAKRVKAAAEASAPIYLSAKDPGQYKRSFVVDSGVRKDKNGSGSRAYGRVTNTAPYAIFVEYGSTTTPKHRTLYNALHEGAKD